MKGYIYESEKGTFLSSSLFWFPHTLPQQAWVHKIPPEKMAKLSSEWGNKPSKYYVAERDEESDTTTILKFEPMPKAEK